MHVGGPAPAPTDTAPAWFAARFAAVADNVERVIHGKRDVIERALVCLFAQGHLLVEDVPGMGKTTLARALAASIGGRLQRIQFTPDLLPSDILGVTVYHQATGEFRFHPGPVFGNIVHGDEINRASPKTQSALLEVMEERQVTVDGHARPVPRPFMVIATQNPVDMAGTYPLPEAQLDRFLMRVSVGYPDHRAEMVIAAGASGVEPGDLAAVTSAAELAELSAQVGRVHLAETLYDYLVNIVAATRRAPGVRLGASPRASVALTRAARARAAATGRAYVVPDDIKALAVPVLAHRVIPRTSGEGGGTGVEAIVRSVVQGIPVPR